MSLFGTKLATFFYVKKFPAVSDDAIIEFCLEPLIALSLWVVTGLDPIPKELELIERLWEPKALAVAKVVFCGKFMADGLIIVLVFYPDECLSIPLMGTATPLAKDELKWQAYIWLLMVVVWQDVSM